MTVLRNKTATLLQAEMDHLGDEITYTPEGGSPSTFNAWVVFSSEHVSSPGSSATKPTPHVEVQMIDVATPTIRDRLTIAIRPGVTYAPADVLEGDTGETWILPLKKVAA